MTIEEKAKAIVTENGRFPFDEYARHRYSDLVQLATEQDRIARQEERDRCIELWCKSCSWYGSEICALGGCFHKRRFMDNLRKATKGDQDEKDNV